MNFLKTVLWVIFIIMLVIFTVNNWVPVSITLWGGLLLDTKLPMLVIVSFLAGFLPLWLWHRATRWRMKRRIVSLESKNNNPPLNIAEENIAPVSMPEATGTSL